MTSWAVSTGLSLSLHGYQALSWGGAWNPCPLLGPLQGSWGEGKLTQAHVQMCGYEDWEIVLGLVLATRLRACEFDRGHGGKHGFFQTLGFLDLTFQGLRNA